jgi:uncharacterized protein Yka (UPF0111/DUF47 family)
LDLALRNRWLVANVGLVHVRALGERDLEHSDDSAELEVIKALNQWLKLVNDGDVADLVDLVESLDSVLDQLSQVHS